MLNYNPLFVTLSILLTAPSGRCAVVYTEGPLPPLPQPIINPSQSVDFDDDGAVEVEFSIGFTICTTDVPTSFCTTPYVVGAVDPTELLINGHYAAILPPGELIGDVVPSAASWSPSGFQGYLTTSWWSRYGREIDGQRVYRGWTGPLGSAGSGYMGVRFRAADGLHYGWIHLDLSVPSIITGWAYESIPDTPILAGAGIDSDRDGVWDLFDQCPDTPMGEAVDPDGCSISQLVPCEGLWRNHGEYVAELVRTVAQFQREGLISHTEARVIVKEAAQSDCGKHTPRLRHRWP